MQMKAFELLVNGKEIQLLAPVEKVESLVVNHQPGWPIAVNSEHSKPIAEWLYNITQRAKGMIEYNGVLMNKEDVNKPQHMQ